MAVNDSDPKRSPPQTLRLWHWAATARRSWIVGFVVVAGMTALAVYFGPELVRRLRRTEEPKSAFASAAAPLAELVSGTPDTLRLPEDVVERLKVRVVAVAPATEPHEQHFGGTLALDPERYVTVRSRFAGEVVEVPDCPDRQTPAAIGDTVAKDELLAVVWSRELGEKKSELVNAYSQLRLDLESAERLQALYRRGDLPERSMREAERAVESDRIGVNRVIRTLQSCRESEASIQALKEEADQLHRGESPPDSGLVHQWARVEVRTPIRGVLLERDVTIGEMILGTDELFKIADLSRLRVVAYVHEEDLPRLDARPAAERRWEILVPAEQEQGPLVGTYDYVGRIIDPAQHTALVTGWVDNPQGRLRVGQFITATIRTPPAPGEGSLPTSALLESGPSKFVFVQSTTDQPVYQLRRVQVRRRLGETTTFSAEPEAGSGAQPLPVGTRVVTTGAVQMLGALRDLQTSSK